MRIVSAELRGRAFRLIVVASVVAGCNPPAGVGSPAIVTTSEGQGPTASASPTAAPSTTSTSSIAPAFRFESNRYGYEVTFPGGWYQRSEGPGKWTSDEIGYYGRGTDSFEEDFEGRGTARNFPGITYGLYVSAAELAEPVALGDWADKLAATMRSDSSCQGEPERATIAVDGEPAIALAYDRSDCTHDHHVVVVGLIHGSMGYDILWLAKRGVDDARRDLFDEIMATFKWTR